MGGTNAAGGENAKYDTEYQDNLSNYRLSLEDTKRQCRYNLTTRRVRITTVVVDECVM